MKKEKVKQYLLLGGSNKRKRKRIDYAKLNNYGFDGSNLTHNQEQNNFDDVNSIDPQPDYKLKNIKDCNSLEKNTDKRPLITYASHKVNIFKNNFSCEEYIEKHNAENKTE